jgi:hypothetical protein
VGEGYLYWFVNKSLKRRRGKGKGTEPLRERIVVQKRLEPQSNYDKYDLDGDGVVSDKELNAIAKLEEIELQEEKMDAQRKMAWLSLISMLVFTALVFLPIFPDSRIKVLADLFGLFYIGMAGICGAYMGMTAYMSRK